MRKLQLTIVILIVLLGVVAVHGLHQKEGSVNEGITIPFDNLSIYPNPNFTPGKAKTLTLADLLRSYNGQTYSQAHRNVTEATKKKVCVEYSQNCIGDYEIDHFYPLCAGGSNDISNLWAEKGTGQWNYHVKDKLEDYMCREIKAQRITPQSAFQCITSDWVACYNKYIK